MCSTIWIYLFAGLGALVVAAFAIAVAFGAGCTLIAWWRRTRQDDPSDRAGA